MSPRRNIPRNIPFYTDRADKQQLAVAQWKTARAANMEYNLYDNGTLSEPRMRPIVPVSEPPAGGRLFGDRAGRARQATPSPEGSRSS